VRIWSFPQISQIIADFWRGFERSTSNAQHRTWDGETGGGSGVRCQGSVGKEAGKGLPALPWRGMVRQECPTYWEGESTH